MKITTFAAIYIGSYEVSLKIFEISPKKAIREIDHVRARVEIGKDCYQKGNIGYELMDELGNLLLEYKKIMEGYRTDAYEAYAGGVFRDIKNELFVLDQLYIRTGIRIKVPSNSEHRFIGYKAVAFRQEFDEMTRQGAAVVDVGGGNLQVTVFSGGRVITSQHMVLGIMRLREQLSSIQNAVAHYEIPIEELVNKDLEVFKSLYLKDTKIKYIIFMGEYVTDLMKKTDKKGSQLATVDKFVRSMRKFYRKNIDQISAELELLHENDPLLVPYIVLYTRIAEELEAEEIWAPGVNVSDGMAYDYAERHKILKPLHDFDEDVISAARQLSERYEGFSPHIDALVEMSALVFDAMKKVHGMGKRERLFLQTAAILHDCGKYVSIAHGAECAYNIIMESEIIGLSHLEREIVASAVLYNTYPMGHYTELADRLDQESYMTVAKLSAILRVSNAMDRSHKQKFKNVKAAVRDKQLVITIETVDDITLEKGLFAVKAEYFEHVFGIKPVIREKRVYK
ncbi:MAG: phosphatase [Eubacterium sp.]|jgi:exopolyphosphatase/guanosine-5'-triphosphate,3'-diphosphate pyrophosphatase|nr:phosphatase [Eubacterium sp.]NBI87099.1 HD domain-containing protein [Lachnospiraceae bacterium]